MHLVLLALLAAAPAKQADTKPGGRLGMAAETVLGSTTLGGTGIGIVYDMDTLSLEGLVRFAATFGGNPTTWRLGLGFRVWYALHQGDKADLGQVA